MRITRWLQSIGYARARDAAGAARMIALALLLAWLFPGPQAARAQAPGQSDREVARTPFEGRATGVADGDTVTITDDDGARHRIRIAGIDAPEKDQPWGEASRAHLMGLLGGRRLRVEPIKRDPFGRTVANLSVDGVDIGLTMVRAGLAWHFVRYAADQTSQERRAYAQAERTAREAGMGLWKDPDPLAPWAWRERARRQAAAQSAER